MRAKYRIAVQNKGRLMEPSLSFIREKGVLFNYKEKSLQVKCSNADLEILFVRCSDIPTYLDQDVVDFAIIGRNVILEQASQFELLEELGFGACKLVMAVPRDSEIKELSDLEGARIATSYPSTLKKYLSARGINAAIVEIKGSVELAPSLNLADAICDITQTGRTLAENGLEILDTVFESEAVLVAKNKQLYEESIFGKTR